MTTERKEDGGPAFPMKNDGTLATFLSDKGISIRDYFAAAALQGILSGNVNEPDRGHAWGNSTCAAKWSYEFADAMLAARGGK